MAAAPCGAQRLGTLGQRLCYRELRGWAAHPLAGLPPLPAERALAALPLTALPAASPLPMLLLLPLPSLPTLVLLLSPLPALLPLARSATWLAASDSASSRKRATTAAYCSGCCR